MEPTLRTINAVISALFFICYTYQFLYIPLVLLKKRRPLPHPAASHRYAVLIAARNEENVIAGLLDSLAAQTYDMSLVTVFVAADNCTDSTAAIARAHGAVVYERFNHVNVGKGYALDFLLQHIGADYPEGFDGYFVFDADNILSPDYLERMNESFSAGNEIVTSYRNSKNFGDNWISAGYALWFLRESRYLNGARNRLGSSAAVGGTGFLFSQRILDESHGWRFYLLTEDIEFSIHHILRGERIAICEDAVLYDEQPTDFRQSCRQRLRWAKGYIQVFRRYGAELLKGTAKGSWSCFDMSMSILPAFILTALGLLANLTLSVLGLLQGDAGLFQIGGGVRAVDGVEHIALFHLIALFKAAGEDLAVHQRLDGICIGRVQRAGAAQGVGDILTDRRRLGVGHIAAGSFIPAAYEKDSARCRHDDHRHEPFPVLFGECRHTGLGFCGFSSLSGRILFLFPDHAFPPMVCKRAA